MSELNYLEKLLDGAGVEWKLLGDASFFEIANSGRKPVKASLRVVGKTPYYGANNIQDYVDGHAHDGEYVLIAEDGSASLENYSIQYVAGKFWANNHVHVIRGNWAVDSRYLFHYLCIVNFIPFLTGGGRAKLTKGQLIDIPVPIPCPSNPEKSLAIQSEIVRILDTFTALTAELTAELTARKKQYNYYRDQLLSFEDERAPYLEKLLDGAEIEWIPIGEVVSRTNNINWRNVTRTYRYIDLTSVDIKTKTITDAKEVSSKNAPSRAQKNIEKNDVIFATTRPTQQRFCLIDEQYSGEVASTGYCVLRANQKKVLPRWIYHWISTSSFKTYVEENQSGSAYPAISDAKVKECLIAIPCPNNPEKSLAIQSEIIRILDKFETLTNSISEGLPREIELRQKQYEYYRDLLFSFPKPESVTK